MWKLLQTLRRLKTFQCLHYRVQDVRLTEIDKVEIHSCFRPGDIVKAEVRHTPDHITVQIQTLSK